MSNKLKTPENIRQFQRKLYLKAKQETEFRFYLLYDKIYRADILNHAYKLVKANKGAPGIDGVDFKEIEEMKGGVEKYLSEIAQDLKSKTYKPMAVKRVYIKKANGKLRALGIPIIKDRIVQMATKIVTEPIFEADFCDNSFGFRPKRNMHQAMESIAKHLIWGKTQIIDADISGYFDNIPHDKALKLIAKRIVDKNVLKLFKMWLTAPSIEETKNGKKRYFANKKGTPQGGVISPLIANIYLNVADKIFKRIEGKAKVALVRYADDMVILCKNNSDKVLELFKTILAKLELELSVDKTKILDARQDSFDFVGFSAMLKKSERTGKNFALVEPSKKALKTVKEEIKALTSRKKLIVPTEITIENLNYLTRGWSAHYYYGNCTRAMSNLRSYTDDRVRVYLRRKKGKKNKGYSEYSYKYLHDKLGLFKIPTSAPWKQPVNAKG